MSDTLEQKPHEHRYDWTVCTECMGAGHDGIKHGWTNRGNTCHACSGRGKQALCAQCTVESDAFLNSLRQKEIEEGSKHYYEEIKKLNELCSNP